MQITRVSFFVPLEDDRKIEAFCSFVIDDCFVVKDAKLIDDKKGGLFVAMPSRQLTDLCPKCGKPNQLRARFCQYCGERLAAERASKDEKGRLLLFEEIAHPITKECRKQIEDAVLGEWDAFERAEEAAGVLDREEGK